MVAATIINVNLPEGESVDPATFHPLREGGEAQESGRVQLDTSTLHSLVKPMVENDNL